MGFEVLEIMAPNVLLERGFYGKPMQLVAA